LTSENLAMHDEHTNRLHQAALEAPLSCPLHLATHRLVPRGLLPSKIWRCVRSPQVHPMYTERRAAGSPQCRDADCPRREETRTVETASTRTGAR
jgi:hypothetical protein